MNISCRKLKCKYNDNYICTRKNILIEKNHECTNYQIEEKNNLQDSSKTMFEIVPEIAPFKDNKDICINCKANCLFNKKGNCMCNGIIVNAHSSQNNNKFSNLDKNKIKESGLNAVCFSYVKE